jgi:hypothetical protein
VKEFYLGVGGSDRKSFRDVKSYKRRKRWLAVIHPGDLFCTAKAGLPRDPSIRRCPDASESGSRAKARDDGGPGER